MICRSRQFISFLIVIAVTACAPAAEPDPKTRLGIRETQFTINDLPVFLTGCSYYGALSADDNTWTFDLDAMQKAQINWIRVWATWASNGNEVSAVDGVTGEPREASMKRLQSLVAECDRRGMVVDITLSRGNGTTGPARLQTYDGHERAVESLVVALKPWRNWYLDLGNERSVSDKRFVSFDDLKKLRQRVRQLDPERLVTASHGTDIPDGDLKKYVLDVQVDFLTPHRPRVAGSPGQTETVCRKLLDATAKLGRAVPVHFQEPLRRGYGRGYQPTADDFLNDCRGAVHGGAAGWCFHNGQSFDLRQKPLFNQLDDIELQVVDHLKELVPRPEANQK